MDEHRVGLKPIIRRVWARRGHRPIIRVQHRYEWLYVYGFVHPESGESQWLLLPSVNIEVFSIALAHFAQAVGAGPDRHVILVLDRAGGPGKWGGRYPNRHPSCLSAVLLARIAALRTTVAALGRRPSPIATSRRSMSCKRYKHNIASLFRTTE